MTLRSFTLIFFLILAGPRAAWGAAAIPKQAPAQKQKAIREQQIQQYQAQMELHKMRQTPSVQEEEVQEIVDISQLYAVLAKSSEAWNLIIDQEAKVMIVEHFIEGFARHGITIQKPALFYAQQIDAMSQSHPEMLSQPFPDILQTVAIIEYDLNNGADKDAMAMKVLGEAAFMQNKRRLGLIP